MSEHTLIPGRLPRIYVGLDVHKKTIALAAMLEEPRRFLLETTCSATDLKGLRGHLKKLSQKGTVYCCYEAGATGFHLQRVLGAWGYACEVIAPSLIPRKPGQRRKNDRIDARRLAEYYGSGLLTPVHIPDAEEEAVRDLLRCRDATRKDLRRCQDRAVKFLRRRGHSYTDGNQWTNRFWEWVSSIRLPVQLDRETLAEYLARVDYLRTRLRELDGRIGELAQTEPYRAPVAFLRGFKGIDTHGAMVLVAELGDIRRFSHPRQLMAYLGLVPSEHTSGEDTRGGGRLTKTGNAHCRHVLIQAAWCYRFHPSKGKLLQRRQRGLPSWLLDISWRAQQRLWKRYHHLVKERCSQVAVAAVARELVGFLWDALMRYQMEPSRA